MSVHSSIGITDQLFAPPNAVANYGLDLCEKRTAIMRSRLPGHVADNVSGTWPKNVKPRVVCQAGGLEQAGRVAGRARKICRGRSTSIAPGRCDTAQLRRIPPMSGSSRCVGPWALTIRCGSPTSPDPLSWLGPVIKRHAFAHKRRPFFHRRAPAMKNKPRRVAWSFRGLNDQATARRFFQKKADRSTCAVL